MELEQQVTSFELSSRLKQLNVKQESLFVWTTHTKPETLWSLDRFEEKFGNMGEAYDDFSAFTVAELLNILPASTSLLKRTDLPTKTIPRYYAETFEFHTDPNLYDNNPANALAKLLILLLENNIIKL